MFTIFGTKCTDNESVYNLIDPPMQIPAVGPPLYRSLFADSVREEFYERKRCNVTMGVPKVWPSTPDCYLKKQTYAPISIRSPAVPKVQIVKECQTAEEEEGEGEACVKNEGEEEACAEEVDPCSVAAECGSACKGMQAPCVKKCREPHLCECLGVEPKPCIPSPCTGFGIIPTCCKDYISQNARSAIRQVPKKPALRFVDDCRGTTKSWCTSGLPRLYVNGENFGKIPCYLEDIKQELYVKDQMAKNEMKQKECDMQEKCRHLESIEREAITCGLKKNWEETFREYQAMPLNIDTPGKVQKKSDLEKALKSLENDIQLIERHDHVFVADTNRSFYLSND